MFSISSKFWIIALIFPVSIFFLAEDCTRKSKNKDNKTSEVKIKTNGAQIGLWGGEHISLNVTEQGAQVEYDCAHGSIDRKIILDGDGRFTLSGTYVEEHGGPIRTDEITTGYAAEYSGQIKSDTMTLKVIETKTKKLVGTFTLVYGRSARIRKCL